MKKIAVVYWSGTGNTQAMAEAVIEGAKAAGADAKLLTSGEFQASMLSGLDAVAFGCPSMGTEELEESEFRPMFDECKPYLGGKSIALFGSYGWGDGGWMRSWDEECDDLGASRVCDSVICNEMPDDEGLEECRALGKALAE